MAPTNDGRCTPLIRVLPNEGAVPHAPLVRIADWGSEAQLVAARDIDPGVLLVGEYPAAFGEIHPGEDDLGPWRLLEAILSSRETFERMSALNLKMTKWPLTSEGQATLERLAHQYGRNSKNTPGCALAKLQTSLQFPISPAVIRSAPVPS